MVALIAVAGVVVAAMVGYITFKQAFFPNVAGVYVSERRHSDFIELYDYGTFHIFFLTDLPVSIDYYGSWTIQDENISFHVTSSPQADSFTATIRNNTIMFTDGRRWTKED